MNVMQRYLPYGIASLALHIVAFFAILRGPLEPLTFSLEQQRQGAVVELVSARSKAVHNPDPSSSIDVPVAEKIPPEDAPSRTPAKEEKDPIVARKPATSVRSPDVNKKATARVSESKAQESSTSTPSEDQASSAPQARAVSGEDGAVTSAKPDYLKNPPPKYPPSARRAKQEGLVEIRVSVSTTGEADEVTLARSSGVSALDDAAVAAVRNWRFKPAQRGGVAVVSTIVVPVRFELE